MIRFLIYCTQWNDRVSIRLADVQFREGVSEHCLFPLNAAGELAQRLATLWSSGEKSALH